MRCQRFWYALPALGVALLLSACGGGGGSGASYHAPTARVGAAQTVLKNASVTLDGSASSDVDGNPLTYAWTQTAGTPVKLSSTSTAKPTFDAPTVAGELSFSLVVANAQYQSAPGTVTITVKDQAPTASAPASLVVPTATQVVLDGSGSADADHDALTYSWHQTGGPAVALFGADTSRPTFTAPTAVTTLTFTLVVSDGEMNSPAAITTVSVFQGPPVQPVVVAGPDFTSSKRTPVLLQAVVTVNNGVPLTYAWQQTAGTAVTLQNANQPTATFTTPATEGDLSFAVTVSDIGGNSAPASVTVHVQNFAPVITTATLAPAAPRRNDPISLSANVYDPDSDPLTITYAWTRNGAAVAATGSSYPAGNQQKGDVVGVTVTVSDGQKTTSATASTTIADTPAILAATPPTQATYDVPLAFTVTATDVDGDATGPFELAYGPAGFAVSSTGNVTWTPNGPMFDRAVDTNWGVRLKNSPAAEMHGTITVNHAARKLPLMRSNIGIPVGNNAIEVQDYDGSGSRQVLVGARQSVYLLAKSGSSYAQSWAYPFSISAGSDSSNSGISAVASGDVDGDGHREIFVAAGPVVVKLDGVTRRESGRYGNPTATATTPAGPYCTGLKYADVDGDGKGELVCLGNDGTYGSNGHIFVLDATTMQLKWQSAALNLGTSLAVGNVDTDADVEIVTSNGFVFDGKTQQNKWAYGPGFGRTVDIGDVIGDGINKIVALSNEGPVRIYDAVLQSPVNEIAANVGGYNALKVVDLDGAAPAEILVGDGQWGNVTIYHYASISDSYGVLAQIPATGDGVSGIAVGDVNGDGRSEIVFGSDYVSSGRDYLTVAAWSPAVSVLYNGPTPVQLDGPFVGARLAQISASQKRLMFLDPGTDSGYAGTRVVALDPASGALSVSAEVDSNWSHDAAFDVADVGGTGIDSMLIGTATLYTDYFTAFDFASNAKTWSSPTLSGGGAAIAHADLNQDGKQDLVGISSQGYVYAFDVAHQQLLWSSTGLGGGVDIAVADLDGDGTPEIIVLTGSQLIVYKASGSSYVQKAPYAISGTALLVADTDGDGVPEIYVLGGDSYSGTPSTVTVLDGNLNSLASFQEPTGASSLYLEQSAFGRKNLVVGIGSGIYQVQSQLLVVDPRNGRQIWASPSLPGALPRHSLNFYDLKGTGVLQLAFGTGVGMFVTQ